MWKLLANMMTFTRHVRGKYGEKQVVLAAFLNNNYWNLLLRYTTTYWLPTFAGNKMLPAPFRRESSSTQLLFITIVAPYMPHIGSILATLFHIRSYLILWYGSANLHMPAPPSLPSLTFPCHPFTPSRETSCQNNHIERFYINHTMMPQTPLCLSASKARIRTSHCYPSWM